MLNNCKNEVDGTLDLDLLLLFTDEMSQKQNMYQSNINYDNFFDRRSISEIMEDNIYELMMCKSSAI